MQNEFNASYNYDGNGNVCQLIGTNGAILALYAYDPFGDTLAQSGPLASENPFKFSTKYWDFESGLYYYGYRFYGPELGRWPNRDPIKELSFRIDYAVGGKVSTLLRNPQMRSLVLANYYQSPVFTFLATNLVGTSWHPTTYGEYNFIRNSPQNYFDPNGLLVSCENPGRLSTTMRGFITVYSCVFTCQKQRCCLCFTKEGTDTVTKEVVITTVPETGDPCLFGPAAYADLVGSPACCFD